MIDLVPLKHFSQRIADGWKMVAGYPLKPGDWAVTMQSPDHGSEAIPTSKRGRSDAQLKRYSKAREAVSP